MPRVIFDKIEGRAEEVLAAYARQTGMPVALPVPIEKGSRRVLGLPVDRILLNEGLSEDPPPTRYYVRRRDPVPVPIVGTDLDLTTIATRKDLR